MEDVLDFKIIPVSENLVWIAFLITISLFVIMSLILNYHWKSYGVEGASKTMVTTLYWYVAVFFLVIMAISALIFNF
jgi:hypothetical protein